MFHDIMFYQFISKILNKREKTFYPSVIFSHSKVWVASNLFLCNGFELRQNQEVIQEEKVKILFMNVSFP